ncbi:MAG: riboflavin synthase [Alphaproteobacteria bacterium]
MFTGIIQSLGSVRNFLSDNNSYTIVTQLNLMDCKKGSSICCDGVCLTVTNLKEIDNEYEFSVNVGEETLKRTILKNWIKDYKINLEKSLVVGDEIAGHFVYGHVDTFVPIININKMNNSWEFEFSISKFDDKLNFKKMIVEKGSIAINGISLTIAKVLKNSFIVSIIPHTFANTNLSFLKNEDLVNIEFDTIARYINKYYEK